MFTYQWKIIHLPVKNYSPISEKFFTCQWKNNIFTTRWKPTHLEKPFTNQWKPFHHSVKTLSPLGELGKIVKNTRRVTTSHMEDCQPLHLQNFRQGWNKRWPKTVEVIQGRRFPQLYFPPKQSSSAGVQQQHCLPMYRRTHRTFVYHYTCIVYFRHHGHLWMWEAAASGRGPIPGSLAAGPHSHSQVSVVPKVYNTSVLGVQMYGEFNDT